MSLARRVKHLLKANGHSLRQAENVTGVSYETIRRIVNGYEGPKVVHYAKKIAQGYKVDERILLDGMDPRADFEWTIRQSPTVQRLEMAFMSVQDRVRLTLDFLWDKHPMIFQVNMLATASGLKKEDLDSALRGWAARPPDLVMTKAIARGINQLTGISLTWLIHGWFDQEDTLSATLDRTCQMLSRLTQRSRRHCAGRSRDLLQAIQTVVKLKP